MIRGRVCSPMEPISRSHRRPHRYNTVYYVRYAMQAPLVRVGLTQEPGIVTHWEPGIVGEMKNKGG